MPSRGTGRRGGRRTANPQPSSDSAPPGPSGTSSAAAPEPETTASTPAPAPAPTSTHTSPRTPGASASASPSTPRGAVQRLHSLNKPRTPGGSMVPLNPDGSTPKPTLRYQPKAVQRRSKEERTQREQAEEEKRLQRIAEAEATEAARRRDRTGGRGRGRGGESGRGAGFGRGRGGRVGRGDVALGGEAGGREKMKMERAAQVSAVRSGMDVGGGSEEGGRSSDESDSAPARFNIDDINFLSESEDEAGVDDAKGKGRAKSSLPHRPAGLAQRPIRVERRKHVKREVDINTEASSSKSAELKKLEEDKTPEGLFVEDDGQAAEEAGAAPPVAADGMPVKEEPDGDVTMVDAVPPAAQRDDDRSRSAEPVTREKKKVTIKDPDIRFQTAEERQEYERHQEDLEYLRKTLGNVSTTEPKTAEGQEEPGSEKDTTQEPKDERLGRLFLFQFPPMTPNLKNPAAEEQTGEQEDGVEEVPPPPSSSAQQTEMPRASEPPVTVKTEDEAKPDVNPMAPSASSKPPTASLINATRSNDLPSGRVGKLLMHKSGATTIDWGGISFKLDRGSDVGFLQDAVVISDPPEDKRVWAMSQVSGKWVVTPDWDKLLDE